MSELNAVNTDALCQGYCPLLLCVALESCGTAGNYCYETVPKHFKKFKHSWLINSFDRPYGHDPGE